MSIAFLFFHPCARVSCPVPSRGGAAPAAEPDPLERARCKGAGLGRRAMKKRKKGKSLRSPLLARSVFLSCAPRTAPPGPDSGCPLFGSGAWKAAPRRAVNEKEKKQDKNELALCTVARPRPCLGWEQITCPPTPVGGLVLPSFWNGVVAFAMAGRGPGSAETGE